MQQRSEVALIQNIRGQIAFEALKCCKVLTVQPEEWKRNKEWRSALVPSSERNQMQTASRNEPDPQVIRLR